MSQAGTAGCKVLLVLVLVLVLVLENRGRVEEDENEDEEEVAGRKTVFNPQLSTPTVSLRLTAMRQRDKTVAADLLTGRP